MTAGTPVGTGNKNRTQNLQDLQKHRHMYIHKGCRGHSTPTHLQSREGVLVGSHLCKQQAQRMS